MSSTECQSRVVSSSSESSDIFCVYTISTTGNEETAVTEVKVLEMETLPGAQLTLPLSTTSEPGDYLRHSYLDLKILSPWEQLRLCSLYYLKWRNLIRFLTILFCIVWFSINAYQVLKDYFNYNTIVVIEYADSKLTPPPAVTFCTERLVTEFNRNSTVYPIDILESRNVLGLIDDSNGLQGSRDDSFDVSLGCIFTNNTADRLSDLRIDSSANHPCSAYTQVVTSIQDGRKCFTFFAKWAGEVDKVQMDYLYQPILSLRARGRMLEKGVGSMLVTFHSAYEFPSLLDTVSHKLVMGKILDLRFEKREWEFRPPPYKPACFEYREAPNNMEKLPEELDRRSFLNSDTLKSSDGRALYRSTAECYLYCMWRKLVNGSTVNPFVDITRDMMQRVRFMRDLSLAEKDSKAKKDGSGRSDGDEDSLNSNYWLKFGPVTFASEVEYGLRKQECKTLCPSPCKKEAYLEVIVQMAAFEDASSAYVAIQWATPQVTRMVYQRVITMPLFLGQIGGSVHIWTALSAVAILRYAVNSRRLSALWNSLSCSLTRRRRRASGNLT